MKQKPIKPLSIPEFNATIARSKYYKMASILMMLDSLSLAIFGIWLSVAEPKNLCGMLGITNSSDWITFGLIIIPATIILLFFGIFTWKLTPSFATRKELAESMPTILADKEARKYLENVNAMKRPLLNTEVFDLFEAVIENKELAKEAEKNSRREKSVDDLELEFPGIVVGK